MKKIYYLTGLPRSGNTLFGSLLNQNPKIQVTANSIVSDMLWNLSNLKTHRTFLNFPDSPSFDNVLNDVISSYYKDWNYEIIFDRSSWGSPNNLKLLEKYSPNEIKFVVLVRDIQDIVASFIKWSEENKPNFLDEETDGTRESKCNHLMRSDLQIVQSYCSIYNVIKSGYPYYLIHYDNLISEPQEVLSGLYDFLNIESYLHYFTDLKQFSTNNTEYDDSVVGMNLHHIKTNKIEKTQYEVSKYISEDLLNYYSTLNF
jgi:sulfotransferase